jgi:hypothetical protein
LRIIGLFERFVRGRRAVQSRCRNCGAACACDTGWSAKFVNADSLRVGDALERYGESRRSAMVQLSPRPSGGGPRDRHATAPCVEQGVVVQRADSDGHRVDRIAGSSEDVAASRKCAPRPGPVSRLALGRHLAAPQRSASPCSASAKRPATLVIALPLDRLCARMEVFCRKFRQST